MDVPENIEIKVEPENVLGYDETADEANNLLKNGILVETSKGLVCMSLNDALSSDLNLSVEDLQNVATQLILQQNVAPSSIKERKVLQQNFNFDSDGFSSECSDVSTTTASSIQSTFITISPILNDIQTNLLNGESQFQNTYNRPKIVSIGSLQLERKNVVTSNNRIGCVPNAESNNNKTTIKEEQVNAKETVIANKRIENLPESVNATNSKIISEATVKPKKGRGGWPKGRKRKPELLNLPPKAPATGYNLYLNEQRKLFKDSSLAFHEITKVIGNKWSSLSLAEKEPYLGKAEEDKKRYREELKQYRQSDAYRAYLAKKRKKRLQNNVLSESDMDATDEIDEEDNEELYCRTCDQWFHNLHNKREHLQGRQHLQSVAGDISRELGSDVDATGTASTLSFSTSLDESSLDAMPNLANINNSKMNSMSVFDSMTNLITLVAKRESEIKLLEKKQIESAEKQQMLCRQLCMLNERHNKLEKDLMQLKEKEKDMESRVFRLWQVPSWFVITDFNASNDFDDCTE